MNRKILWFGLAGGLCALAVTAQQNSGIRSAAAQGPVRHVIIVSVDGLMPATYLSPDVYGLKVPTLREMARSGAWSPGAAGVFPTVTYPSHTSMVTGVTPGTHGIVSNETPDPMEKNNNGWWWYAEDIRVPTLWDAARAKGLRTALVWWPVTVGARGTAVAPEIWRASTPDDAKLARALASPGLFTEVEKRFPGTNASLTPPGVKDEILTNVAVHLLETQKPHLLLLHIFQVDHFQHEDGPLGERALPAIETADAQIARLIEAAKKAGIWQQTALFVVSDHGFRPISQRVRLGVLLRQKGLLTLDDNNRITDSKAFALTNAGSAYLYVRDPNDAATRALLLETFRELASKPGSGIGRVLSHEEIVLLGGDPNAFLALEAADGSYFVDGHTGDLLSPSTNKGTHGYLPARDEMKTSLLIYGPMIASGRIENARLIDIGPTAAHMLGLSLPKAEGRVLDVRMKAGQPAR